MPIRLPDAVVIYPHILRQAQTDRMVENSSGDAISAQGSLAARRVMVVDDEPGDTSLVRVALESSGFFKVCEVNDPAAALDMAHRFRPHLVLIDILMPGLDGSEVAARLRADRAFHALPIIFMTGP